MDPATKNEFFQTLGLNFGTRSDQELQAIIERTNAYSSALYRLSDLIGMQIDVVQDLLGFRESHVPFYELSGASMKISDALRLLYEARVRVGQQRNVQDTP